ncbi:hypothetical protein H5410_020103, partial [Solanum commersonii]
MDELTLHIQEVPWCMLCADNITLIGETCNGFNDRLKYLGCKFSDATHEADVKVWIDIQVIPKRGSFKYLGLIIQGNGEIDDVHIGMGNVAWGGVLVGQELARTEYDSSENEDVEIDVQDKESEAWMVRGCEEKMFDAPMRRFERLDM